ncbi:MAG: peptidase M14 [Planctomycetes bacterium]|nr:peptidase M14 [Planctomycetota bacterium]
MIGRNSSLSCRRGGLLIGAIGIVLSVTLIGYRDAGLEALGDLAQSGDASISTVRIDADYPGGNIIVERIRGDRVFLRPDLRDTKGWWFYWNFRVRGAAGRTMTFQFTDRNPIGVRGPAVSTDGGATWSWLGRDSVRDASFVYAFPDHVGEVRFAFTVPYLQRDLRRFLDRYRSSPHLAVRRLCRSRKRRSVERIHVGSIDREPKHRIVLTARHHACESMASFALEGFLESVLAEDELGRWYQQNVEVLAIPFVDKDGVEDGDQGKNRRPHDHNRDYGGKSIYPSVIAIKKFVPAWSQGKLKVWIDLHCPWIRGGMNEMIYQVGLANTDCWREQQAFGRILEAVRRGPLVYANDLPFGKSWNTQANYGNQMSSTMWAAKLDGIQLVTTIELPYANVGGQPVTPASARQFGRDLAKALRRYLEGR